MSHIFCEEKVHKLGRWGADDDDGNIGDGNIDDDGIGDDGNIGDDGIGDDGNIDDDVIGDDCIGERSVAHSRWRVLGGY